MSISFFDAHCDTLGRCFYENARHNGGGLRQNTGHVDLTRGQKFAAYAQFFAIFGDGATSPIPLPQVFEGQYAIFSQEMERNQDIVAHCRTMAQAKEAIGQGKIAAFLSVEGAELLECSPDRLEEGWQKGVRMVNLTWNHENALSGSNHMASEKGLTGQGRAFVQRMQSLGMLVDVSHLSDPGFWDVAELAERAGIPFVASHSNCRSLCPHKRNLTDDQLRAVMACGGVVGLNFCDEFIHPAASSLERAAAHVEHIWSLGGAKTAAVGGDWDGCSLFPGVKDITDTEKLYELLLKRNYSETLVRDLFFHNFERVVNEVCTM